MDNNLPNHEPASDQEVSNPEADAFFRSLVDHVAVHQGEVSAQNPATATGTQTPEPSTSESGPPLYSAFSSPGQSAMAEVACGQCRTTIPAGSHICYICGTPRVEYDEMGYRVATAAPGLKATQKPYDPYEKTELNENEKSVLSAEAESAVDAYSSYPRRSFTPEEPVFSEPEPGRKWRPIVTSVLTVAILVIGVYAGWNARFRLTKVAASLRQGFAQELADLTGKTNPKSPVATSAPERVSHATHLRTADLKLSARAHEDGPPVPETRSAGMHVRIEGQPEGATVSQPNFASGPEVVSATSSPMAVHVSPRESLALLLHHVPPVYPREALDRHVQGSVALKALIGKNGSVVQLQVMSGNELLVPAAIQAVKQWQYKPYYKDGEPQEVETTIVVDFSLAQMAAIERPR